MPELSQDAIRELRQALPILKRLFEKLDPMSLSYTEADCKQLQSAYNRVLNLTSSAQMTAWVNPPFRLVKKDDKRPEGFEKYDGDQIAILQGISERLYLYVQGILESERVEETLNHLTQENASLKEQLAELRRRESTYIETIKEAQTSTTYSLPSKSREILLNSSQHQHATLVKNLARLQEAKAQYGLNVPLDILNAIDQTQEDLERIEAQIADLKASKTDTNRKT